MCILVEDTIFFGFSCFIHILGGGGAWSHDDERSQCCFFFCFVSTHNGAAVLSSGVGVRLHFFFNDNRVDES